MTRFGKITTGILFGLLVISQLLWLRKFEGTRPDLYDISATLFLPPILLSILLKLIFNKSKNTNRLQWLPNTLNTIAIILTLIMISWYFEPLTNYDKAKLEQKHIEKAVQHWIKDNASYPDSYKPIIFERYFQVTSPVITEIMDPEPIGYYVKEFDPHSYDYAYYFIWHQYVIKNKSEALDTVITCFRLNTDKKILDVTFSDHYSWYEAPDAKNQWRVKYGKDKKNLDLELNGTKNTTYYYRYFNKGRNEILVPYLNGKINGVLYCIIKGVDTVSKITFKNSIRNGPTEEICPKGIVGFRGNCINGKFCGLSTWWHCNGQKESEGIRVNDIDVGIWKYWDEEGKLIKTENKGRLQLLDSIPKEAMSL